MGKILRHSMNFLEIMVSVFIIGTSLLPIFLTFSSANRMVAVGIEDFEAVNTLSEIQEQVQQFPLDVAKSLTQVVVFTKGNQPLTKLGNLELFISTPPDSCEKISLIFKGEGSKTNGNEKLIFLIKYEVADSFKGKLDKTRNIMVGGIILP